MSCDQGSPDDADVAVRLDRVGKAYRLYEHPGLRLLEMVTRKTRHTAFEALSGLTFAVRRGETVGIVGENGSGKSTLLKLIAGVLNPTSGLLTRNGRVAAVLELGAGFDPAFSGRSNARLGSALMGYSPRQIDERLERIEDFAEIGEFMDRPVRTYSSGMLARLAFACAVHQDPDILLVDEALAVGDMFFQAKCLEHLRRMIRNQGTTLLFVSHDVVVVNQLCSKALYLEKGRIKAWGQALEVTDAYRRDVQLRRSGQTARATGPDPGAAPPAALPRPRPAAGPGVLAAPAPTETVFRADANWEAKAAPGRYGLGRARFRCVEVLDADGAPREFFTFQEAITVRAHVECLEDMDAPHCGILIRNKEGVELSHAYTVDTHPYRFAPMRQGDRMIVQFTFANIYRGNTAYIVYLAINNSHGLSRQTVEDQVPQAALFISLPHPDHPIHYLIWQDFQIAQRRIAAAPDAPMPPQERRLSQALP